MRAASFYRSRPTTPAQRSNCNEQRGRKLQGSLTIEHIILCCKFLGADVKTNITLKIDADLLREVRVMAAQEGTSIIALLAARLEKMVRERKAYDGARRRALAWRKQGLDLRWTPPRSRDDLHER
jgi:hypothetical protein